MNRKYFLSIFGNFTLASILTPTLISCISKIKKISGLKNWAGNYTYKADETIFVSSVNEIKDILVNYKKVKALGTQHCFNDIADTKGVQVSTNKINEIHDLNTKNKTVLVSLRSNTLPVSTLLIFDEPPVLTTETNTTDETSETTENIAQSRYQLNITHHHGNTWKIDGSDLSEQELLYLLDHLKALAIITNNKSKKSFLRIRQELIQIEAIDPPETSIEDGIQLNETVEPSLVPTTALIDVENSIGSSVQK